MKSYWIPEAPKHHTVYAPADYKAGINTATTDPWKAMKFTSKEDCQKFCDENQFPVFIPVEHRFEE